MSDFEEFLDLHAQATEAIDAGDPNARERTAKACATPDGARYASFYERRLAGLAPELALTKNPGGS